MSDVNVRIPIEIILRVGAVDSTGSPTFDATVAPPPAIGGGSVDEAFLLDEDYDARPGYDPNYLGKAGLSVPLPTIKKRAHDLMSRNPDAKKDAHVLKYHHFSVVMNRKRRLLFFAACNTTRDPNLVGSKSRKELGRDKWILDPRIPAGHQVSTKELYGPEDFDRGHIVRREDGYWGETDQAADFANWDTFHYTNCTPQASAYNQSSKEGIWGLLENHIAKEAEVKGLRLSIFAGPYFRDDDPKYRGIRIPRSFWKVVVGQRKNGKLAAWGFRLGQTKEMPLPKDEAPAFEPHAFGTYQVPIAQISARTDVEFAAKLRAADTLRRSGEEAPSLETTRPIRSLGDIQGIV